MLTQEERLTSLEQNFLQFRADTVKNYQEMAMQVTMFRGLTETIIGRLATMQYQTDQRFDKLEARVDTLEIKIDKVQTTLDTRIDRVQTTLEAKIDSVQATLEAKIDATLTEILARLPEKA